MQAKRRVLLACLCLALLSAAAVVWAELYLRSQNSLVQNGHWVSSKQRMHVRLEQAAAELDRPVLDLHGFVKSPPFIDSGFLWWDYVHFSSHGHRRAAEWSAPRLADELRVILREREIASRRAGQRR